MELSNDLYQTLPSMTFIYVIPRKFPVNSAIDLNVLSVECSSRERKEEILKVYLPSASPRKPTKIEVELQTSFWKSCMLAIEPSPHFAADPWTVSVCVAVSRASHSLAAIYVVASSAHPPYKCPMSPMFITKVIVWVF